MSWQRVVIIALCLITVAFVAYFAKDALAAVIAFISGLITGLAGKKQGVTENEKTE